MIPDRIVMRPWRRIAALVCAASVLVLGLFVAGCEDDAAKQNANQPDYSYDVQTFEDQGRDHIPVGEVRNDYNSNPPTSGPHGPLAAWGIHDVPVPKESAIHNMEHGGVVVWYNCEAGDTPLPQDDCDHLLDQLTAVIQPVVDEGKFVLMTAFSDMKHRMALTAWRTLDAFDAFDADRIRAFIASFECEFNPEAFC